MILWSRRRQPSSSPTAHVYLSFCVDWITDILAQEAVRGMREAASRGFWVASRVPYGYRKLMVQEGAKKRPTLEPDAPTSAVVERIFGMAEAGRGILDITRTLNDEGIANPTGRLWSKSGVHIILRNESYTGTLVWARLRRTRQTRCGWRRHSPPSSPRPGSAG